MFQIESAGIKDKLAGGIVITGGGSLLKNLKQLATFITNNDIRIAYPTEFIEGKYSDILNKPQFSTAIGLIMKGESYYTLEQEQDMFDKLNEEVEETEEEIVEEEKPKGDNSKLFNKLKNKMAKLFDEEEN